VTAESAAVLAMRQLVGEAHRPPFGVSRSRHHTLERLAALAERRAALRGGEPLPEPDALRGRAPVSG
jgi:hypothetical protein